MKNINKFYEWYSALGGRIDIEYQGWQIVLNAILNIPLMYGSSFKNRAEEVKKKYNYKFVGNDC